MATAFGCPCIRFSCRLKADASVAVARPVLQQAVGCDGTLVPEVAGLHTLQALGLFCTGVRMGCSTGHCIQAVHTPALAHSTDMFTLRLHEGITDMAVTPLVTVGMDAVICPRCTGT